MLTACGSVQGQVERYRQDFVLGERISMTAQVQADCGGTVDCYTLEYSYDGTDWRVLVTEPAVLSGISARIGEDAADLEYDGAILAAGDILSNGVTPIGAVPMLARVLEKGSLDSAWTEGDLTAGTFVYDDGIGAAVWFDQQGVPAAAELSENGIVKLSCKFTNGKIEVGEHGTTENTDLGGDRSDQSGA